MDIRDLLSLVGVAVLVAFMVALPVQAHPEWHEPFELEEFILPDSVPEMVTTRDGRRQTLYITDPEILDEIKRLNNMVPPYEGAQLMEIRFIPLSYIPEYFGSMYFDSVYAEPYAAVKYDEPLPLIEESFPLEAIPNIIGFESDEVAITP